MRLRHQKNASLILAQNDKFIAQPIQFCGLWHQVFANNNPIHLEIGGGKGKFISSIATDNPACNFIVIEKYASVAVKILPKINTLANVRLIVDDAKYVTQFFATAEITALYLNFSDPWPKRKHHHRRLTSVFFFTQYDHILKPNTLLYFKSDNKTLFHDTVHLLQYNVELQNSWKIIYLNDDQKLPLLKEFGALNYQTEYETRFRQQGVAIQTLIVKKCYN